MSGDSSLTPDDGADELGGVLRDRMLQAVAAVEPRPGTLEYLHSAVPARRKRRNAALTTTAVTVLAVGAAATLAGRGVIGGGHTDNGAHVGNSFTTTSDNMNGDGGSHRPGTGKGSHTPTPAYASTPTTPGAVSLSKSGTYIPPPLGTSSVSRALPNCQNSSMSSVAPNAGPVIGGVSYETVTATVAAACTLAGPPQLTVLDAAGAVSSEVGFFKADGVAAPALASVPTWGRVLTLKPGDKYQFQFAWVPTVCPVSPPPPTSPPTTPLSGTPSSTGTPSGPLSSASGGGPKTTTSATSPTSPNPSSPNPSQQPPAAVPLTVAYSLYGAKPIADATFTESCGAAVYVTDIFQAGDYPEPHSTTGGSKNAAPSS